MLEALIGVDGIARDIEVIMGIGFGCNKAAIEALKASRFIPAKSRGTLIVSTVRIPYRFQLVED